jgi:hypothetical protein
MKVDMGFCLVAQPRPIETAQRFSMAHPKSLRPTLAVTLWPVPKTEWWNQVTNRNKTTQIKNFAHDYKR